MGPIISECTRPIFTKFLGLVDIWVETGDDESDILLRSLKGRCYGNQFKAVRARAVALGFVTRFVVIRVQHDETSQ